MKYLNEKVDKLNDKPECYFKIFKQEFKSILNNSQKLVNVLKDQKKETILFDANLENLID